MGDLFVSGGVSNFPTSVDSFTTQTNVSPTITFDTTSIHASKANNLAQAILNLQTKVNTTAGSGGTNRIVRANAAGNFVTDANLTWDGTTLAASSSPDTSTVGTNLVANGNFSTVPDTSWTFGSGWTHNTTTLKADHASATGGISTGTTLSGTADGVALEVLGSGYVINDTLRPGGTTAVIKVVDVSGGALTEVSVTTAGSGYSVTSGVALTAITGTGTGATLSIVRLTAGATLSQSLAITAGTTYRVNYTISNRTKGEVRAALGGVNGQWTGYAFYQSWLVEETITTTTTGALTFTPTTDFDGSIDDVTVQAITFTNPSLTLTNADASVGVEGRAGGAGLSNIFLGLQAGRANNSAGLSNAGLGYQALRANTGGYSNVAAGYLAATTNTTGFSNIAVGDSALQGNTLGFGNVAVGLRTLQNNTTGTYNVAVGRYALPENTSGTDNTAVGYTALRFLRGDSGAATPQSRRNTAIGSGAMYQATLGSENTAVGFDALAYNGNSSFNVAIGSFAGYYQGNGTTTLTNTSNSIYIGYKSKGKNNSDTNAVVIGDQAAGNGSNTVVLGNSSITSTTLFGRLDVPTGHVTGTGNTPTAGAGLELAGGTAPFIQAYNRDTAAYLPLNVYGTTFTYNPSVSGSFVIGTTGGLTTNGTAAVTSFGPAAVTSITIKNGLVTAIS